MCLLDEIPFSLSTVRTRTNRTLSAKAVVAEEEAPPLAAAAVVEDLAAVGIQDEEGTEALAMQDRSLLLPR